MLPKISIITPTLNQVQFIEQTIKRVLSQGYENLEYIVIDGGSNDGTIDILRRYENSLFWQSEPDKNQVDAINKGFKQATGDIITYLNSDDYYEPGALLTIGAFFLNNPSSNIVTARCHNVNLHGNKTRRLITHYKNFLLSINHPNLLKICNYIAQPSTFFRRSLIEKYGFFNLGYRYAMDYDYWLRVNQKEKIYVINKYLSNFRIYPSSITSSNSKAQFKEEYEVASHYSNAFFRFLHKVHTSPSYWIYKLLNIKK